jgi:hypothetical protein
MYEVSVELQCFIPFPAMQEDKSSDSFVNPARESSFSIGLLT